MSIAKVDPTQAILPIPYRHVLETAPALDVSDNLRRFLSLRPGLSGAPAIMPNLAPA